MNGRNVFVDNTHHFNNCQDDSHMFSTFPILSNKSRKEYLYRNEEELENDKNEEFDESSLKSNDDFESNDCFEEYRFPTQEILRVTHFSVNTRDRNVFSETLQNFRIHFLARIGNDSTTSWNNQGIFPASDVLNDVRHFSIHSLYFPARTISRLFSGETKSLYPDTIQLKVRNFSDTAGHLSSDTQDQSIFQLFSKFFVSPTDVIHFKSDFLPQLPERLSFHEMTILNKMVSNQRAVPPGLRSVDIFFDVPVTHGNLKSNTTNSQQSFRIAKHLLTNAILLSSDQELSGNTSSNDGFSGFSGMNTSMADINTSVTSHQNYHDDSFTEVLHDLERLQHWDNYIDILGIRIVRFYPQTCTLKVLFHSPVICTNIAVGDIVSFRNSAIDESSSTYSNFDQATISLLKIFANFFFVEKSSDQILWQVKDVYNTNMIEEEFPNTQFETTLLTDHFLNNDDTRISGIQLQLNNHKFLEMAGNLFTNVHHSSASTQVEFFVEIPVCSKFYLENSMSISKINFEQSPKNWPFLLNETLQIVFSIQITHSVNVLRDRA